MAVFRSSLKQLIINCPRCLLYLTLFNLQGTWSLNSCGQLVYPTTKLSVCQEVFSNSFKLFSFRWALKGLSLKRSHILSDLFPFVNTFFRIFLTFFKIVFHAAYMPISCASEDPLPPFVPRVLSIPLCPIRFAGGSVTLPYIVEPETSRRGGS